MKGLKAYGRADPLTRCVHVQRCEGVSEAARNGVVLVKADAKKLTRDWPFGHLAWKTRRARPSPENGENRLTRTRTNTIPREI